MLIENFNDFLHAFRTFENEHVDIAFPAIGAGTNQPDKFRIP
jgi:hypothetical protein